MCKPNNSNVDYEWSVSSALYQVTHGFQNHPRTQSAKEYLIEKIRNSPSGTIKDIANELLDWVTRFE